MRKGKGGKEKEEKKGRVERGKGKRGEKKRERERMVENGKEERRKTETGEG